MQQEASEATATRQCARGAEQTQIRARITHVGSEYRKDVTSGTCELCITEWSARIRDISFELADVDTGATWQATTPTLHVGRWNDIWEVRVNPFHLAKALAHVTLIVDTDRLHNEGGRALIALGILEAVEACTRASEMVERLDGAHIHDNDWDEEQFVLEPSASLVTPTKSRSPFVAAWVAPSGCAKSEARIRRKTIIQTCPR